MIPFAKIKEIMERLLEKSRADQVNWIEGPSKDSNKETYEIKFPKIDLSINRLTSNTTPNIVNICVFDEDATVVANYSFLEGDPDWGLANGLFEEAVRTVTGWDRALHDLEEGVRQEGKIGLLSPPAGVNR